MVCGRFNDLITNRLLDGAANGFGVHGVNEADVTIVWVPGAFEIPIAAKAMAETGGYDAVVTLGAVIRGDTPTSTTWPASAPRASRTRSSRPACRSSSGC